ncbi:MAG: hypothetical protein WCY88_00145 [Spongiibacteraceae bacterium]|jgi:prepilin signal peptidase PulO-like enzyme (type II secretory pathway)
MALTGRSRPLLNQVLAGGLLVGSVISAMIVLHPQVLSLLLLLLVALLS